MSLGDHIPDQKLLTFCSLFLLSLFNMALELIAELMRAG